jgi:hypothetical protein
MSDELRDLFFAEKRLSGELQWVDGHREGTFVLVCPLEIEGVTMEGLRLRASALKFLPDEELCIQMEFHGRRQKFEPMCRFEWRPLSPHDNKGRGPAEFRFRKIRGSHTHPFEMNLAESMRSTRSRNLRIAIPVVPDPATFEDALEFAGKEFRINNMRSIPRPLWQARMI